MINWLRRILGKQPVKRVSLRYDYLFNYKTASRVLEDAAINVRYNPVRGSLYDYYIYEEDLVILYMKHPEFIDCLVER